MAAGSAFMKRDYTTINPKTMQYVYRYDKNSHSTAMVKMKDEKNLEPIGEFEVNTYI